MRGEKSAQVKAGLRTKISYHK